ncbi:L,D-transpeptidase catalytic domain [Syntrophus gentianae]|uniref:L,D-transpeptidase catalytic domain n=1 Tax=Syntrophus gentianae TaxID=43775 RepID=A0A1H7XTJ6_9BACT|nr:L,D-transpeptidase family protein [Syntrophus gentianae]SEM37196.1 L,D-transpeptidase catalytic domain [Syntrophus gentianae]
MFPLIFPVIKRSSSGLKYSFFIAFIMIILMMIGGCGPFHEGFLLRSHYQEADDLFSRGSYRASLSKYEQIMNEYPEAGDGVLFKMGVIYAYPENEQRDYQKSLECFQKILNDYPESGYRQDSKLMIPLIKDVMITDKKITTQQRQIEALDRETKSKGNEILALKKKVEALEQRVLAMQNGPAEKILILKKERLLMLMSKGKVFRAYTIALGKNPTGPKEQEGDNKTPEGTYTIDSRNRDSAYHLALHISYPNEKDKMRARKLGVAPGGNIMIHGIKNGFSWIGEFHTGFDWTKGCIAVTDDEIEEIARLAPNGTAVEIRP